MKLFFIIISLQFLIAREVKPLNLDHEILLRVGEKDRLYQELTSDGLEFKENYFDYSNNDSIRIAIYSRAIPNGIKDGNTTFSFFIQLNGQSPIKLVYTKKASLVTRKDSADTFTKSGVHYLYVPIVENNFHLKINPLENSRPIFIRITSKLIKSDNISKETKKSDTKQDVAIDSKLPFHIKIQSAFGYDNNFLRLSEKEIREDDVTKYGIASTLDSPILKPTVKLIFSPAIIDEKITNIITSISYSHFTQAAQKSYLISNVSIEMKLHPYSWVKVGIRDIPKYYLRDFHDRDLSNIDYYECTFSSQGYFASYSLPIKRLRRTWVQVYADYTKEYYNSHFTEFDLNKTMFQSDLNHKNTKYRIKFSLAHGNANNISYGSNLPSTAFDRSYVFDKVRGQFVYKTRKINKINDIGISVQLEQRYYNLLSEKYSFDNWKYYLDGRAKMWVDWDIIDNIGFKTYYQFRWRDASTQIYGDFDWVEDIKSYSKHEIWLEFSYKFITDILY